MNLDRRWEACYIETSHYKRSLNLAAETDLNAAKFPSVSQQVEALPTAPGYSAAAVVRLGYGVALGGDSSSGPRFRHLDRHSL